MRMREDNKGLTVKINLWSMEKNLGDFDPKRARLWIRGLVTRADKKERKFFRDAGELISILGKWNAAKLKELKGHNRHT